MSQLLSALQENLLVLLTFDDVNSKIIRGSIDINLYGGQYREIAVRIYDYLDRYKKAPQDHVADILSDKISSENHRESSLYQDILNSIFEVKDRINTEYVMNQLETFVRRQSLRSVAVELTKALTKDTEESLAEADSLIRKANSQTLTLFNPGTRLNDKTKVFNFFEDANDAYPTGISELDKRGFGPTRKEFWLGIADKKKGKTWMLTHLGKIALMNGLKTLHITLEVSESIITQRYFMTFFAMSKRNETYYVNRFRKDSLGRLIDLEERPLTPKLSMDNPDIIEQLSIQIDKGSRTLGNIYVKEFPTGSLTVPQLEAYLDNLAERERFVPDLLILDYPDLMKIDSNNLRGSLDILYKELRGVAVSRNIAIAAVSQSNRSGSGAKKVDAVNVAEAYNKLQNADTVITYSQTDAEKRLGLARLSVIAGRNDADGLTIIISQNYGTGQFVLDNVPMDRKYFQLVGSNDPESEGETNDFA